MMNRQQPLAQPGTGDRTQGALPSLTTFFQGPSFAVHWLTCLYLERQWDYVKSWSLQSNPSSAPLAI